MSDLDVASIKAEHVSADTPAGIVCLRCFVAAWPCLPYRLAVELERVQAASEGVDMLIVQAERRGAVKALRDAAWWRMAASDKSWLKARADLIENGADL